ncbi:SS nuclear autoantigen 1 [Cricetulus griseus]
MTQQGAALQNYNNELVKCIEELCQKREELCRQIQQEEDEKQRLQNEVRQLTEKLARVNENLARKIASRNEFDRTIAETEAAYLKVGLSAVLCQCLTRISGSGPLRFRGCSVYGIQESEQAVYWKEYMVWARTNAAWLCREGGFGECNYYPTPHPPWPVGFSTGQMEIPIFQSEWLRR